MALALSYVGSIRAAISYTLPALILIRFASRSFREFRYRLINPVKNFLLLLSFVKCQSIHCVIPVFPIRTTRGKNQSGRRHSATRRNSLMTMILFHFFSRGILKTKTADLLADWTHSSASFTVLLLFTPLLPQFHS